MFKLIGGPIGECGMQPFDVVHVIDEVTELPFGISKIAVGF